MIQSTLICSISCNFQVDLIDFSGPAFMTVDNRVAALRLVQKELCDAALFDPSGMMSAIQGGANHLAA